MYWGGHVYSHTYDNDATKLNVIVRTSLPRASPLLDTTTTTSSPALLTSRTTTWPPTVPGTNLADFSVRKPACDGNVE
jgi:hypothetical protein